MTRDTQFPWDPEGVCMRFKSKPPPEESRTCGTCVTPRHVPCLSVPPETLASTLQLLCPDCSGESDPLPVSRVAAGYGAVCSDLVAAIHAIEADGTTPCWHNACLICFLKWMGQRNRSCGTCRSVVPKSMASNPYINFSNVSAIRIARVSRLMRVLQKLFTSSAMKTWGLTSHLCLELVDMLVMELVVLSGGYEDDEDHGEWFQYAGRLVSPSQQNIFGSEATKVPQDSEKCNAAKRVKCKSKNTNDVVMEE
ncbi:unnamed protein product [Arabidopsis arenosa]|uniref:E3 ubiquitin-protein ligase ORTHRUS n=1 Tax=Arabidopsis arenosa TaxID=38785 RepID=A0A8S1ZUX0_ARAAE|nr:unnamed protein product [Arabidopsis arenosa]